MRIVLALASFLAFAVGTFAITTITSDIQTIIVILCFIGGTVFAGLLEVVTLQRRILAKIDQAQDK